MLYATELEDGELVCCERAIDGDAVPSSALPVLNDGATVGALMALVRRSTSLPWKNGWAPGYTVPLFADTGWRCRVAGMDFDGATEAEALVAALEHAP